MTEVTNYSENTKEVLKQRTETLWAEALIAGRIVSDLSISPEQRVLISDKEKGVSDEEVVTRAHREWPPIMKGIRQTSETITTNEWGYFMLPVTGQFDKDDPKKTRMYPLAFVPTAGCSHMLNKGGCLVCNYGENGRVTTEVILAEAEKMVDFVEKSNEGYKEARFNLNASGSFFDDIEMPPLARTYVLKRIARYRDLHPEQKVNFLTESRLEFITEEKLQQMREILGNGVLVEIGYGLESANRLINEGAMNKYLPKNFEDKIKLMKKYGVDVTNHILLKPPFLTEKEAVEDAVNSIKLSYEKKLADLVILMAMNVRPGTLTRVEYEHGLYNPPNIWAIIKVMKDIGYDLAKRTKFLGFSISEVAQVSGTVLVSGKTPVQQEAAKIILRFNGRKEDYDALMTQAESEEYKKWERDLNRNIPNSTIAERISSHIDLLKSIYNREGTIQE